MCSTLKQEAELTTVAGSSSQMQVMITRMTKGLYDAAAEGNIRSLIREMNINAVEHADLLEKQVTPNKNTVLHIHIAARPEKSNSTDFVEEVLKMCPSLLQQANAKGDTPLHVAARYGHADIVKVLIARAKALHDGDQLESGIGSDTEMLRMRNEDKDTALHEAARYNHVRVVQLLTEEDPDYTYPANNAGETPLYLAAERGFQDVVSAILENCNSPAYEGPYGSNALHAAVVRGDTEMARKMLRKNPSLNKGGDQIGWTPLHHAASLGHISIVEALLESDESVAYLADDDGKTALHIAALNGKIDIMKELISRCPDCCELVDNRGRNVLHIAAVLLKSMAAVNGALEYSSICGLINDKDADGNTPLHLHFDTIHLGWALPLVHHPRLDKMALNKQNLTPLDVFGRALCHMSVVDHMFQKNLKKGWGFTPSIRRVFTEDWNRKAAGFPEGVIAEPDRISETHLVVAALIATVTFAAGFTMPGGYNDNNGPGQGQAILSGKAVFKAFVITDTIAMVLSSSAVIFHFFMANLPAKKQLVEQHVLWANLLIITSMGAMVVAFMLGIYAVLPHSSGLAIATCLIACSFFVFFCKAIKMNYEINKKMQNIM